jgi:quercetin dioxygenase-like cupin family protein
MFNLAIHSIPTDDTAEWAALFSLGLLSDEERERFEEHRARCAVCRDQVTDYAAFIAKWALSSRVTVPVGARERFLSRVKEADDSPDGSNPVLLHRDGLLIARSSAMEWRPGAASGIWTKPLFSDPAGKYGTTLVRMDKGVRYPRHRHADVEEVFLLEGDFQVEGNTMRSGDYCRAEANSIHNESFTVSGCLFILKSSQLDEVLP